MRVIALRDGHDAAGGRRRKGEVFDLPDTTRPAKWFVKVEPDPEAKPAKAAKQEKKTGNDDLA